MPKKERQAKLAAFAMEQELNSEMTDEQKERMLKSGMGTGVGGLNTGESELFGLHTPALTRIGLRYFFCQRKICLLLLAALLHAAWCLHLLQHG